MKITSPVFVDGGKFPVEFTAQGQNHSPPLRIEGIPPETKSVVLIMDDPDAPSGIFTHWIVFDIPPSDLKFERGKIPATARLGLNDFGRLQYGGPNPPTGEHRYFFHGYALDRLLTLPEGATRADIENAMKNHIIGRGKLMATYAKRR